MSFPFMVAPGQLAKQPAALDEKIWANADRTTSGWKTQSGGTSNIYQSVDSDSDSDYVELISWILDDARTVAFRLESPSDDPSGTQTVQIKVNAKYLENFEVLPNAPKLTIKFDEGGTQRAVSSPLTLTKNPAEYSLFLTEAQINSVGSWANVEVEMLFDNSANTGPDEEAKFRCHRCRVIFSP